jgi:hypothetical protein
VSAIGLETYIFNGIAVEIISMAMLYQIAEFKVSHPSNLLKDVPFLDHSLLCFTVVICVIRIIAVKAYR